ncbi:hypothetical protein D3C87_1111200 [compost metagenome]
MSIDLTIHIVVDRIDQLILEDTLHELHLTMKHLSRRSAEQQCCTSNIPICTHAIWDTFITLLNLFSYDRLNEIEGQPFIWLHQSYEGLLLLDVG